MFPSGAKSLQCGLHDILFKRDFYDPRWPPAKEFRSIRFDVVCDVEK